MNNNSRIKSSMRNMTNGMLSQFISLILNFVVRTVFLTYLNKEYLSINGLFTNILTVLSLAELGFGTAMVYSMYKPLADNDTKKLQALMNLYGKVYSVIGIIVAIIGLSIIPFMDHIIKYKPDIENITFIYLMFLANSVLSYFFSYKRSILSADQKEYISSQYRYIFTIIKSILQIGILIFFKNFILYLLIQILMTLAENIFISYRIDKLYPFLKERNKEELSKNELKKIKDDVKALVFSKFGNVILNGTDNIIISSIIGIQWIGMLSNYTLITGSLTMILSQISSSITGSVGNFIAKETKESQYTLFKRVDFVNFWIYGFSTICLIILLNPFIQLWIGREYILNESTVVVLSVNFFISGLMSSLWTFRSTMGLFIQGKYRPLMTAFLNIVISIFLGKYLGLIGVLLGTTISRLIVNLSFDPFIIYKYGFKRDVKSYYIKYIVRCILLIVICFIVYLLKIFILNSGINIFKFSILILVCTIIPNIIFIEIYYNKDEFKYIKSVIKSILSKIKLKYVKRL